MIKWIALSVNLLPYIIAAVITICGVHRHRKKAFGKIAWIFPLTTFEPAVMITAMYTCIAIIADTRGSILSLTILFIGYLMIDFAFYIAMQPTEYNASFYLALVPLGIGVFVSAIAFLLMWST